MVGTCSYHFKEHCSSDRHPVQLDLEGSVEGEIAVIITAAPFCSVTAVVNVHIQSDSLLLWDCRSYGKKKVVGDGGGETGGQEAKEAGDDGMIGGEMNETEQRW